MDSDWSTVQRATAAEPGAHLSAIRDKAEQLRDGLAAVDGGQLLAALAENIALHAVIVERKYRLLGR